jgi:hypothetical protein
LRPRDGPSTGVWRFLNSERWRAYWIDDGPEEKLLFYCPDCSEREFGRH